MRSLPLVFAAPFLGALLFACERQEHPSATHDSSAEIATPTDSLSNVLLRATPGLMEIPGVVGTAEGRKDDRSVLLVLVSARSPELARRIPAVVEGYTVEIRAVGTVHSLDSH